MTEARNLLTTIVDNAGVARGKLVPAAVRADAASAGVGLSPILNRYQIDDSIHDPDQEIGPTGDLRLVADLDSGRPLDPTLEWAPSWQRDQAGAPDPGCQREFLRRMESDAEAEGLAIRTGIELEWCIGRPGTDLFEPAYPGPAYGAATIVSAREFLGELLARLEAARCGVRQLHAEYRPGQFELSMEPGSAMQSADRSVFARQLIHAVSAEFGVRSTFAPMIGEGDVGSGAHLTISLVEGGRSIFGLDDNGEIGARGRAALGGVLAELPGLVAVGAACASSYLRFRPGRWAGGYLCWGLENREAAIRLIAPPGQRDAARIELKFPDASANPYSLSGAVIAACLDGIRRGAAPPEPVVGDPARLEVPPPALPQAIEDGVAALAESLLLPRVMGDGLYRSLLLTREGEALRTASSTPVENLKTTLWRL